MVKGTTNTVIVDRADGPADQIDIHDIIVAMLDSKDGLLGNSTIQAIAYLAKITNPHLAIPDFESRYFGPGSAGVYGALADLIAYRFVREDEFVRYSGYRYRLSDDGERFAADVRHDHPDEHAAIRMLITKCTELCCGSSQAILFATKMHWVCVHNGPMSQRNAITYGNDMSCGLTENEMYNGLNLLRTLGFDISRAPQSREVEGKP